MKKYLLYFFLGISHLLNAHWDQTDSIWNFAIISHCKGSPNDLITYFKDEYVFNPYHYHDCKSSDILWVPCRFIGTFCKKVLPNIHSPFVLVIANGDESFPSNCEKDFNLKSLLSNKNLLHIFAQNCDYQGKSKKITHLPIGIDFHTYAYKMMAAISPTEQEEVLKGIISEAVPTTLRIPKAFVDFQHSDTTHGPFHRCKQFGEDRQTIFKRLQRTGLIDYSDHMPRSDLWRKKANYAFSISPYGNGLDCHRTWEDLALGCIVIVKSSPLDPLYEDLPVVIVKDWDEVTKKNMKRWLKKYGDAFTNPSYREKLTNAYWLNKIYKAAIAYINE